MGESCEIFFVKSLVRKRREQPVDMAGVLKTLGKALRCEPSVVVAAERDLPAVARKFTEVHDVVNTVTDGGPPVACKKCAEQVQPDDAVTPENLSGVIVTKMPLIVATHDRTTVGVSGDDSAVGAIKQIIK